MTTKGLDIVMKQSYALRWIRIERAVRQLERLRWRYQLKRDDVRVHRTVMLQPWKPSAIQLGPGTSIGPYTVLDVSDAPNQSDSFGRSSIVIGEDTFIGWLNNIAASGSAIAIGNHCLISELVSIVGSNHHYRRGQLIRHQGWSDDKHGVRICDDVWIGSNTTVLPGVCIGEGAVVGAGAVVTRDVPPYSIVTGVPARVVGERS